MAYKNFFDEIKNMNMLKEAAKIKGQSHDYYSFYSSMKGIQLTLKKGIRLTTGNNWNDPIDIQNIKSEECVRFIKCFTYSKSENIAMWMLYSGCANDGCMLKFSKGQINNILTKTKSVVIGVQDSELGVNENIVELDSNNFKIELIDVIYCGFNDDNNEDTNTIVLKKSNSISNYKKSDFENIDIVNNKYDYFIKSFGWSYEVECRLIVEVNKDLIPNYDENKTYFINLHFESQRNYPKVFMNPNSTIDNITFENDISVYPSSYRNKINWNLLDDYKKYLVIIAREKVHYSTM